MKYSPHLFENLPAHVQYADEQFGRGELKHFCQAIDGAMIWPLLISLEQRSRIFDVDDPLAEPWLDFVGQFVGLARWRNHWIGRGLNPKWSAQDKAEVIKRAWAYWQAKGSVWGVKESVYLWLRYPGHESSRFRLESPMGDRLGDYGRWWDWKTPYGYNDLRLVSERRFLGFGDYATTGRLPMAIAHADGHIAQSPPQRLQGSRLSPRQQWQHFYLADGDEGLAEWQRIIPDAITLANESTPVNTKTTIFLWRSREVAPLPLTRSIEAIRRPSRMRWSPDGMKFGEPYHWDGNSVTPPPVKRSRQKWFRGTGLKTVFRWGDTYGSTRQSPQRTIPQSPQWMGRERRRQSIRWGDPFAGHVIHVTINNDNPPQVLPPRAIARWNAPYGRPWAMRESVSLPLPSATTIVTEPRPSFPWDSIQWCIERPPLKVPGESLKRPGVPYFGAPWSYPETVAELIPTAPRVCKPGLPVMVPSGTEEVATITPAVPGNLTLLATPPKVQHQLVRGERGSGGRHFRYGDPVRRAPVVLSSLDISGLTPIAINKTVIASSPELSLPSDPLYISRLSVSRPWFTNATHDRLVQHTSPAQYKIPPTARVARWNHRDAWRSPYLYCGIPAKTKTTIVPTYRPAQFCNVVDRYSLYRIKWIEYIPPSLEEILGDYPDLPLLIDRHSWQCHLTMESGETYILPPRTCLWGDRDHLNNTIHRSKTYTEDTPDLILEFSFGEQPAGAIQKTQLVYQGNVIDVQVHTTPLPTDPRAIIGLRWAIPVILS